MDASEIFGRIKKDKNMKIKIYKKFLINIFRVKSYLFKKIKYLPEYLLEKAHMLINILKWIFNYSHYNTFKPLGLLGEAPS